MDGPRGARHGVAAGEAVIWHDGRMDFGAVQARAASSLDRARALAARLPATYAAFDVLAHPDHGGDTLAARPYTERRTVLVDVLAAIGPPLQPSWPPGTGTPPSSRRESRASSPSPVAVRTRSAAGPCGARSARGHHRRTGGRHRRRPRRLALLPDTESRPRLSAPLDAALAARLGALLADVPATGEHRTETGETDSPPSWWSRCWPGRAATAGHRASPPGTHHGGGRTHHATHYGGRAGGEWPGAR